MKSFLRKVPMFAFLAIVAASTPVALAVEGNRLSSDEIFTTIEQVIRSHPTNFIMKLRNPAEYNLRNKYFDLNKNGFVTISDELIVRNQNYSPEASQKLLNAACDGVDEHFGLPGANY